MSNKKTISVQGHRGARGWFPENTITSFIGAIEFGVDTIEMDVVISKDMQVVVSHEAWMNEAFCSLPTGEKIEANSKYKYNLFKMPYSEIVKYDCGVRGNKEFPSQKKIAEHKPLLTEVIEKVELYTKEKKLSPIKYNIEIKTEEQEGTLFNPEPNVFVELVYNEIERHKVIERTNLQSFDVRILQEIKKKYPNIEMALLVENNLSLEDNLKCLGFVPNIYSPDFCLVSSELVSKVHDYNMKLIPWTVNEPNDINRMLQFGVNGIISDYPDRVIELIKKMQ